jgi:hypothetical protein
MVEKELQGSGKSQKHKTCEIALDGDIKSFGILLKRRLGVATNFGVEVVGLRRPLLAVTMADCSWQQHGRFWPSTTFSKLPCRQEAEFKA